MAQFGCRMFCLLRLIAASLILILLCCKMVFANDTDGSFNNGSNSGFYGDDETSRMDERYAGVDNGDARHRYGSDERYLYHRWNAEKDGSEDNADGRYEDIKSRGRRFVADRSGYVAEEEDASGEFGGRYKLNNRNIAVSDDILEVGDEMQDRDPNSGFRREERRMHKKYTGYYKVGNPYKIGGKKYHPKVQPGYREKGVASWYGEAFHGKETANGEIYDMNDMTAAHRTLPLPCVVEVTNLKNGKKIVVRVNDRGPFAKDRIIDLSRSAARKLEFENEGTTEVKVVFLRKETEKLLSRLGLRASKH